MKNKPASGKLLWAFNPFQDSLPALESAAKSLIGISRQAGWKPEPVYVVSPTEVNVVLEFSVPASERYRSVALKQSQKILKAVGAEELETSVLVEKSLSLTAATRALTKYADRVGAEAILAGTRSGKGLKGSLLGSFAETLLHQARCPVLLVPPGRKARNLRRLLFVSDLSPDSLEVFKSFCRLSRALNAEILLYHSIPRPFSWATFAVDALLGPDRDSEKKYLILTYHIDIGIEDVADSALKFAKKRKIDLIGVAGKSGRLKTRLLGSITKSLLQLSTLPIWIEQTMDRRSKR
jgi:nucleotide-binding universal stress UspA family protein